MMLKSVYRARNCEGCPLRWGCYKSKEPARTVKANHQLMRYKDDVKEVATNFECGISLVNFNDIQVGDIIETFQEIEVQQKL